jgi:hypothetical protein
MVKRARALMAAIGVLSCGCGDMLLDSHPPQPTSGSGNGSTNGAQGGPAFAEAPPGKTITADAPLGFDPTMLGLPLDGNFRAPASPQKLFPYGQLVEVTAARFTSDQKLVSTAEELSANAQAWGVLDVGMASAQRDRYAYFRAVQVTTAWELRTNGPMLPAPPWAVYYASKVYFGRSYVEVVRGDENSFNARVGAHFLTVPVGVSIRSFVGQHRLTSHRAGVGFTPKGGDDKAIFARTEQEIEAAYVPGPPVPIAVEYTQLPHAQPNGTIIFPEPRRVVVRFETMHVGSTGSMLRDYSNWTLFGDCSVEGPPDTDLDEPATRSQPFLQQRISAGGPWPLQFSKTIWATDEETITCTASGSYTRGLSSHGLGRGTTGPIRVGAISGETRGTMPGRESETNYDIAWTAVKQ